jgi:hydroxymethylglutaryl-CoA lyase
MRENVLLREVAMRDGLQSIASFMPTEQKKAWLTAEAATGVREIEVTSLVPPKLIPQFADAAEVARHALGVKGLTVSALIPNLKGAERGMALGLHKLNYVVSVSEGHNLANVRRTTRESMDDFKQICALRNSSGNHIKIAGGLATAFGCSIDGHIDEGRVIALAHELVAAGADELIIADTVGYGDPAAVKRIFGALVSQIRAPIAAHFHNTRGLGLANVLAALEVGIRHFDASLGGLGGCPYAPGASGNVTTEDCVFMLEQMGFDTGIDLQAMLELRRGLERQLSDVPFHGDLARAGLPKTFPKGL